jgi:uncharacterized membrane protein
MKLAKLFCNALGVVLLLSIIIGMFSLPVAEAATKVTPAVPYTIAAADAPPQVKMSSQYPVLSGVATTTFSYEINIEYTGTTEKKVFNLALKGPGDYTYAIQRSYGGDTNIGAIELDPTKGFADTIKVTATPKLRGGPKPGEYPMTLELTSGSLKYTFDMKAVVTERYSLSVTTPEGLLNTNVEAGKDNFSTFTVKNTGDSPLEKIKFRYNIRGMPSGWRVTFKPEDQATLAPNGEQVVEMNIKPSEKTIAGDYEINLSVETESLNASDSISLRVTVLTPTIWGWLGVIIVVLVVVALMVIFVKFGRR